MRTPQRLNRIVLYENFKLAPALNAVIVLPGSDSTSPTAAALLAYTKANKDFEVLGTNMTTALSTLSATGGITLTTAGASNDQGILLPHLGTPTTSWTSTLWDTAKSATFETVIKTPATVTLYTAWAGYKLTNTSVVATDDDQAFFSLIVGTSTRWQYTYSIAGVDVQVPVPLAITGAVAASTIYKFRIEIYSDRTHMAFVNDEAIASSNFPALTSLTTLIPYIGVQANTSAARALDVKYLECTRVH